MKKLTMLLLIATALIAPKPQVERPNAKSLHSAALRYHRFTQEQYSPDQLADMPKRDRPDLAWRQNFLATMDPALGRPAPERLATARQMVRSARLKESVPGSSLSPWVERGPTNVGGRTRALMFDPNDSTHKKVWAGGVTGGLWFNNDITDPNSSWVAVDDFWDNIAISAIAADPTNPQIFYVGTGEGWGAGSGRGAGIWKTTDGGQSWSQLPASSTFYYVHDLIVRDENGSGVLYAGLRNQYYAGQWHGSGSTGLHRSTDGGQSFSQVLPNAPGSNDPYAAGDLEIGVDNILWVATRDNSANRGGGNILKSTDGLNFTVSYSSNGGDRVELACAPSDSNYLYALIEIGNTLGEVVQSTDGGQTWTSRNEPDDADNGIPASDFTRGQAWYDLTLAVDPTDEKTIVAGGIDLFRSTDEGQSWSQISKWSNNNQLRNLPVSYVHADQHAIIFKPGSGQEVIFGNDGGVFYTNSLGTASSTASIQPRNENYNVTQFYATAMHPQQDYYLAGAQDNGSQKLYLPGKSPSTEVTGGDGAFCFIDQDNPNYQLTSYVYNNYWRSTNGGQSFNWSFILSDNSTGRFINPADYDDRQNALYSAKTNNSIYRLDQVTGANPTPTTVNITGMQDMASHLRVSPHSLSSTTLFVGTDNGDIFKVLNADSNPSSSKISGNLPAGNISCIEIGATDNELLVTYSNYGLTSVWYTNDGGQSWQNKEGNLPDMPVRWALFNPNNRNEVILATELGVWSSLNFNNSNPVWNPSNNGLSNVRVDMLQIRDSDDRVAAATFGRGLFTSDGFQSNVLSADFTADKPQPCLSDAVSLRDRSNGNPQSWQWDFTPNTVNFINGSTANSKNPEVRFTAAGSYDVRLIINNGNSSDTLFKKDFITASIRQPISFNIAHQTPYCKNQVVALKGSPAGGSWSGTGVVGNNFLTSLAGDGKHMLYYTVAFGSNCSTTDSIELSVDIPPKPTITQSGNILNCNVTGYDYSWFFNGNPIGGNTQSINLQGNGSYSVRVSKSSSACFEESQPLQVNTFSTAELKSRIGFRSYPNPVDDHLKVAIESPGKEPLTVKLLDLSGKVLKQRSFESKQPISLNWKLAELPAGIYLLQVSARDYQIQERILKL